MDPKLLSLLVCPVTKGPLDYVRGQNDLAAGGRKQALKGMAASA